MSDLFYKIALTKIPGVGAVLTKQLVAWCGGIQEVFTASKKDLLKIPGIGKKTLEGILAKSSLDEAEKEMLFLEKNKDVQTLFYLDKNYPARLRHFNDSPVMLYYRGNTNLDVHRTVAIVGTRKPSEHGKIACEDLVKGLKKYNPLVISGLAYGIDITAHRKCLEEGIPTVGALGHGLDMIYPASHRKTAHEMVKNGGLISEFTSAEGPDGPHFPMRNRIIAALSDAVIVVESGKKGGSVITAEIANSYNKDVFAIPGRLKDKMSEGTNHLIKINKAHLLTSADDIGYIMGWEKKTSGSGQMPLFVELTPEEKNITNLLTGKDGEAIDAISYSTGMAQSELASLLLNMEFKGIVKSLPGKRYILT